MFQCLECEMVFANPPPTGPELEEYNTAYFDNAHQGLNTSEEGLCFFSGIAQLRLHHFLSYAECCGISLRRVLEIGPGHGFLCKHFKAKIPDLAYVAVESDLSLHSRLEKLGAEVYSDLSDVPEESFDMVVASHVLEHLSEPVEFARALHCLIAPGGCIFIEVPCRDFEFKDMDEPHLLFFDKPGMERLLQQIGFREIVLSYHGQEITKMVALQGASVQTGLRVRIARKCGRIYTRCAGKIGIGDKGPASIDDVATWAAVRQYEAHLTREEPSWWLRAMAKK